MKKAYAAWLGSLVWLPPAKKKELVRLTGSAKAAYGAREEELTFCLGKESGERFMGERKKTDDAGIQKEYEKNLARGMNFISIEEADFPEKLRQFASDPYGLYYMGGRPNDAFCVAIVGARKSSGYGETLARRLGKRMGSFGIPVISGMARGIDSAAQRSVLEAGGTTTAVLGCGVNVCYPAFMRRLYADILREGTVLSEYPPDTEPRSYFFPVRNRIIAALSDLVIVLEGGLKSGSLITARQALDYGRDVYALPGRIDDEKSAGCNALIREGAQILSSEEALFEDPVFAGRIPGEKKAAFIKEERELAPPDNLLYSCVGFSPKSLEEIQQQSHLAPGEIMQRLTVLEIEGLVRQHTPGWYVRQG